VRVLMLVRSDVAHDARVLREARSLADDGHEVVVIGHHRPAVPIDLPDVEVHWTHPGTHPPGPGAGTPSRGPAWRVARWLLLPEHRRRVAAAFARRAEQLAREVGDVDVVHAHDFEALVPGARLAARHDVPLVYDAHECWTEWTRAGRPTPLQRRRDRRREQRLGGGAACVLTVSDGIRDWFLREYGWTHVDVVRNSFPARDHDTPLPATPSGIVYAGRVDPDRDLATVAAAAGRRPGLELHVAASSRLDVTLPPTVTVHPPLPVDEVDTLYRRLGIAVVPLVDGMANHRLALPNKLFHAVRAGVPVVAADLPELRRVVAGTGIGTLYTPGSVPSLLQALDDLVADYPTHVRAVARARDTLSWEHDERVLRDCYRRLGEGDTRPRRTT
jgi:glycogen(starch) synthase